MNFVDGEICDERGTCKSDLIIPCEKVVENIFQKRDENGKII